jgi:GDPmannose 4,6-dehydratase
MEIIWEGEGLQERGLDAATGAVLVEVDPRYFRPTEVDALLGDASKAKARLGWSPRTGFRELVADMMREDMEEAEKDVLCKTEGFRTFKYHE